MNRTVVGIFIAVVAIVTVGFVVLMSPKRDGNPTTSSTNAGQQQTDATDHSNLTQQKDQTVSETALVESSSVEIKDFAFQPKAIRIKKGTTVTWTNSDSAKHDITPHTPSDDFKASELLEKGESFKFTFNKTGVYTYFCSPHPYMKGSVEVVD